MNVLVMDIINISQKILKDFDVKQSTLNELLRKSDYIPLHLPLTENTYLIIGKKEFSIMKDSSCLINTERGGIVNEEDLLWALKSNQIKSVFLM